MCPYVQGNAVVLGDGGMTYEQLMELQARPHVLHHTATYLVACTRYEAEAPCVSSFSASMGDFCLSNRFDDLLWHR